MLIAVHLKHLKDSEYDKKCENAIPTKDILETDTKKEFIKLLKERA